MTMFADFAEPFVKAYVAHMHRELTFSVYLDEFGLEVKWRRLSGLGRDAVLYECPVSLIVPRERIPAHYEGRHDWCRRLANRIDAWVKGCEDPESAEAFYAREVARLREQAPA